MINIRKLVAGMAILSTLSSPSVSKQTTECYPKFTRSLADIKQIRDFSHAPRDLFHVTDGVKFLANLSVKYNSLDLENIKKISDQYKLNRNIGVIFFDEIADVRSYILERENLKESDAEEIISDIDFHINLQRGINQPGCLGYRKNNHNYIFAKRIEKEINAVRCVLSIIFSGDFGRTIEIEHDSNLHILVNFIKKFKDMQISQNLNERISTVTDFFAKNVNDKCEISDSN